MKPIVEVEFKGGRNEVCLNPMEFPFKIGDLALVEVDKGEHIGRVSFVGLRDKMKDPNEIQNRVLRKASPDDLRTLEEICLKERESMKICMEKVHAHSLPMKLVDVEYQFDLKKLTFYFTAEGRVDFRELVKDLAGHFRVRIELRQIGVRDETKRLGGFGVCGRQLCCTTFLNCFSPITTQMARVQNLSLNPKKLSGACGRLKCCLKYELDLYMSELKRFPLRESVYLTPKGEAIIEKIDIFTDCIYLKYRTGEWEKLTIDEIEKMECLKEGPPTAFNGEVKDEEIEKQINEDIDEPWEKKFEGSETESKKEDIQYKDTISPRSSTPFPSDFNE